MRGYIGGEAQRKARARRAAANATRVLIDGTGGGALGDYVRAGLMQCWSPQQIAGRLRSDHAEDQSMRISPEAIYQWVYRRARAGEAWHRQLRRSHRRRRHWIPRRNRDETVKFKDAVRINQRPAVVEERSRIGDWESDTVIGSRRPGAGKAVLATHVERKSRYVMIRKIKDGRSATFTRATVAALRAVPADYRHTLTADNGSEFARFATLQKKLGLAVYFADPYAAWQRGANENTNGLIRQFFPKGASLAAVTHQQVAKVQDLLNNRPRKCLNYRTPAEIFGARFFPPGVALRN
jgi:IS30 family transposase